MEINIEEQMLGNLEIEQKNFLDSSFGKLINSGIDFGLKTVLPDFLEDEVIEIKNAIFENGFKAGLNKAIETGINIGKSAIGIFTGKFENISQIQMAVQKGGIIDNVSGLLDKSLKKIGEKQLISDNSLNLIKKGKNVIINQISKNIENGLISQTKAIEKIEKYCENWKGYFNQKDFNGMEKEYKKIEEQLKNIVPIEKNIKDARNIENLHNLIKNNGKNFELSQEEIELSKMLV